VAVVTGLAAVPLTVGYLGSERYGVWLTLSSLLNWFAVSDFGLGGNALVNALADADGREDRKLTRELVSTAFWMLVGIAALLTLLMATLLPLIPLAKVFNVSSSISVRELMLAVAVAFGLFALNFPTGVFPAVYYGHQEGSRAAAWATLGNLAAFAALLVVTRREGGLMQLVLGVYGARLAVNVACGVHLVGHAKPWLRPSPGATSLRALRRLAGLGSHYALVQLASVGVFQSQPIILTHAIGPTAVVTFSVALRLLSLPITLVQLVTGPLMPAFGEARARGDWSWIWGTLRRSLLVAGLVASACYLVLGPITSYLVRQWVGPAAVPEPFLVALLCAYGLFAALAAPLSSALFGLERTGGQAGVALLNAAVTVGGGVALAHALKLPGMGLATAAGMLVNLLGQILETRRMRKSSPRE
jgi:O-antigen/teichoic acid export membrane protein